MSTELTATSGFDASLDRSSRSLLVFPTNSRVEYNRCTRRKLQEKNRAIEGNFGFVTGLKTSFSDHVVARGIFPHPITNDPDWNFAAKADFMQWATNPAVFSVDGSSDFWDDQRRCGEELGAGDGEVFSAFVDIDGELMVQPLDPFEVESPLGYGVSGGSGTGPSGFYDGVRSDRFLRPVEYAVRELPDPSRFGSITSFDWRRVPAGQMIHLFKRRRAKQTRGIPPAYSTLNDEHDALDTLAMAKHSAKLHEALAVTKTVKAGSAGGGLTKQIQTILTDDGDLTKKLEEKLPSGAAIVELKEGEALQLLTSTRPSSPTLEGVKFYCQLTALGHGLPLSIVFSFAGLGGTATRADLERAQRRFEMVQDAIVWRHSQRVWVRRTAYAMNRGLIPKCKDPYWWANAWRGPAKLTVDYGRTASANIELMKNGMLSIPSYCDERDQDWEVEQDRQIQWIKRGKKRCTEEGIEYADLREPTPGAVTNVKVQQQGGGDE